MSNDAGRDLVEINGCRVPNRIWLIGLGCGDIGWSNDPDPACDGEAPESVEYVRAAIAVMPASEVVEALRKCQAVVCEYHCGTGISGPDHEPECVAATAAIDQSEVVEALRAIADHDDGVPDTAMECPDCHDRYLEPYTELKRIARAALANHSTGSGRS